MPTVCLGGVRGVEVDATESASLRGSPELRVTVAMVSRAKMVSALVVSVVKSILGAKSVQQMTIACPLWAAMALCLQIPLLVQCVALLLIVPERAMNDASLMSKTADYASTASAA